VVDDEPDVEILFSASNSAAIFDRVVSQWNLPNPLMLHFNA
jgi:hypothetical protein